MRAWDHTTCSPPERLLSLAVRGVGGLDPFLDFAVRMDIPWSPEGTLAADRIVEVSGPLLSVVFIGTPEMGLGAPALRCMTVCKCRSALASAASI